jgi:hypothetical protein
VIHKGTWTLALLLLTSGCTEVTWWDARGSWSGAVTLPGGATTQRADAGLSDPTAGPTEDRIELCESNEMVLSFTFVPIQAGQPAALEVETGRPLCQEGTTHITGGTLLVWRDQGGNVTAAERSNDWTVTGTIDVTEYLTQGLPDLDAGDVAETDHVEGRISLTATDGAGNVIRIEDGSFELTVVASRVKLSIS